MNLTVSEICCSAKDTSKDCNLAGLSATLGLISGEIVTGTSDSAGKISASVVMKLTLAARMR